MPSFTQQIPYSIFLKKVPSSRQLIYQNRLMTSFPFYIDNHMDEESEQRPQIPMSHFLSELKKAMQTLNELFEAQESKETILEMLQQEATNRRPWHFIQSALLNHQGDLQWLQRWCKNSQSLL
jgi:hypothetical protein